MVVEAVHQGNPRSPIYPLPAIRVFRQLFNPTLMSSITASCANFQFILDAALESYTKQTGIDLTKHPSADKLQYCHSPEDIEELLLERETAFKDYRNKYGKLIDCVRPAAQIVHAFSGAFGEATGVSSRCARNLLI